MACLHSDDGKIHVCIPEGHYIGQLRTIGHRRWRTVTGRCRSLESAGSLAMKRMAYDDKRVRVLFVPTPPSYYDPNIVFEGATNP